MRVYMCDYSGIYFDSEKSIIDEGIKVFSLQDHIKTSLFSVPFYDLLKTALKEHDEGKHSESVKIYSELSEKGCQLACYNLGNCYLFGVGAKKDLKKVVDMFGKCGTIKDDDLKWMRLLSNDRHMETTSLDLHVCFFFSHSLSFHL